MASAHLEDRMGLVGHDHVNHPGGVLFKGQRLEP